MKIKPLHIFIFLTLLFLTYSFTIYLQSGFKSNANMAADGRLVWQKYNCQSCHQLYGLGGYLGPDLTNEMANPNAQVIILSMLKNGVSIMPSFKLSGKEQDDLVKFLAAVNASGVANPRSFKTNMNGTIEQK